VLFLSINCSNGAAWRVTGLTCSEDEDVCNEDEISVGDEIGYEDDIGVEDKPCHQPLVGSYLVKLLRVTL
jgi:hypothetical protein